MSIINNVLSNVKEFTPENEHLIKWMLGTMSGGGYDTVSSDILLDKNRH
jgi:hypothetical protein